MPVLVTEAQATLMRELQPVTSADQLQQLLERLADPMATLVKEVMEPDQPVDDTRLELADLLLLCTEHMASLEAVGFGAREVTRLRDAIVALLTVHGVFSNQVRLGDWRARPVDEVTRASLFWRSKLRAKAAQAFFFDEAKAALFQDHNASGTVEEECADLRALVHAVKAHGPALAAVGFTEADIREGERLLSEAEGRDIQGLIGIRSQTEMKVLRDRLLTLCVVLARHARACAQSAFWDAPDKAALFERASCKKAIRRLRPARSKPENQAAPAPSAPAEASRKMEGGGPTEEG
jgi:hypothetical protein